MNSPVYELKPRCPACKSINLMIETWSSGDCAVFDAAECMDCHTKVNDVRKWNTRAESPDSVEDGKWSAIWIDAQDKQPSIKFWAESHTDVERICDALNNSAYTLSPPPPVAAEGELEGEIKISGSLSLHVDKRGNAQFVVNRQEDVLWLTAREFDNLKAALQSRSTPPPVGWGRLPVSLQRLAESWQQEGNFLRGPNDCELDHAVGRAYLNCRDQLLAALQHQDGVFTDKQFSHEAADAFWKYWNENGETDKHGYYESTWGAIWRAIWTDYPHLKQSLERKNGQ